MWITKTRRRCCAEIHAERDRTAIEVLNQFVEDPQVVAKLSEQLRPQLARRSRRHPRSPARSWRD